ncbi:unnamed protein product, partial [Didymodactylos carnosus]
QYLQLLILQKLYSDEYSFHGLTSPQHTNSERKHNCLYQVFLGGSCNPTTWRHDQAIPYFQSRCVSYFNPQVSQWTEDLVEIEHQAKELAPLLFFVIDQDTRALSSIIEVSYLAAKGRNLIVVMNDLNRQHAKFLKSYEETKQQQQMDDDFDNVYQARKTLKILLKSINIPIFDSVSVALEYAAFLLDITNRTSSEINENNNNEKRTIRDSVFDNEQCESRSYSSNPYGTSNSQNTSLSSPVVIRQSLSNKTIYQSNDEFYEYVEKKLESKNDLPLPNRRNSSAEISLPQSLYSKHQQVRLSITSCPFPQSTAKRPLRLSNNESLFIRSFLFNSYLKEHVFHKPKLCSTQISTCDSAIGDDSDSLLSRTLSSSSSLFSSSSDFYDVMDEQQNDEQIQQQLSVNLTDIPIVSTIVSKFSPYIPFIRTNDISTQSLSKILKLPFRFLRNIFQPSVISSIENESDEVQEKPITSISFPSLSSSYFDIYYAGDNTWYDNCVSPLLEKNNITCLKQMCSQLFSNVYDIHARKQCRLIYYVITNSERLSNVCTELAFLIGEHKAHIVICLQYMDEEFNNQNNADICDINRSRKYLEDLARKENITLYQSLDLSLQHVIIYLNKNKHFS